MTIIAYRNKELAADTLVVFGTLKCYNTTKIIKANNILAGAAGDNIYCLEFLDWASKGCIGKPPKTKDDQGLVVTANGEIRIYYSDKFDIVQDDYVAIGSGCDVALGALYMGANSYNACLAAMNHVSSCGGKVELLTLE